MNSMITLISILPVLNSKIIKSNLSQLNNEYHLTPLVLAQLNHFAIQIYIQLIHLLKMQMNDHTSCPQTILGTKIVYISLHWYFLRRIFHYYIFLGIIICHLGINCKSYYFRRKIQYQLFPNFNYHSFVIVVPYLILLIFVIRSLKNLVQEPLKAVFHFNPKIL